jgi:hypothetical protein
MKIDGYRLIVMAIPLILILDVTRPFVKSSSEGRTSHSGHSAAAMQSHALTAAHRRFLEKEYDTAVREIRLRVDNEETLFALKFTMVGAVLAAMFYMHRREDEGAPPSFRSPWAATCCWAAVLVGAVIDIRRQFNVDVMVQLGTWVHQVEDLLLPDAILGWEQFIPTSELWSSPIYALLRLERELVTWILFVVTVAMFVPNRGEKPDFLLLRLSRLFCCLSMFLFGLNSLHYHYQYEHWWYWIYCSAFVVLGCAITFRWIDVLSKTAVPEAPHVAAAA